MYPSKNLLINISQNPPEKIAMEFLLEAAFTLICTIIVYILLVNKIIYKWLHLQIQPKFTNSR